MAEFKFPALGEFSDMVMQSCKRNFPKDFKAGFDEYLNENEAQEEITSRYEETQKKYNAGQMTADQVTIGAVSSVANCLNLMWDCLESCKL